MHRYTPLKVLTLIWLRAIIITLLFLLITPLQITGQTGTDIEIVDGNTITQLDESEQPLLEKSFGDEALPLDIPIDEQIVGDSSESSQETEVDVVPVKESDEPVPQEDESFEDNEAVIGLSEPEEIKPETIVDSCSNPQNWIEFTEDRTLTSKSYYVRKSFEQSTVNGIDVYISGDQNQEKTTISATEFISNPNPQQHPEYFEVVLCSHTETIHYKNIQTDSLEDIDSNIYPNTSNEEWYSYHSGANSFTVYFGNGEDQDIARFVSPDVEYALTQLTIDGKIVKLTTPSISRNSIVYPKILPGVDVKIDVHAQGFNKYIVIKNEQGLEHDFEKIDFGIRTSRDLVEEEDRIGLSGIDTFSLLKPVTSDSSHGEVSQEEFDINDNDTSISVYPNQEYLRDSSRIFPIMIDPGADIVRRTAHDAFVRSTNPWSNYGIAGRGNSWFLSVGKKSYDTSTWSYMGDTRTYLNFNISGIGSRTVRKSYIQLEQYNTYKSHFDADIYRVDQYFNEADISWNKQPALNNPNHSIGKIHFPFYNFNGHGNTRAVTSTDLSSYLNDIKQWNDARLSIRYTGGDRRGAIFCSKEQRTVWGHPCSTAGKGPILQIWLNNKPLTPVAHSVREPGGAWQENNHISARCDESQPNKKCTVLGHLDIAVENINGGEGDPAYSRILGNDRATDPNFTRELTDYGNQKHLGRREQSVRFPNGMYRWHAQSKDEYGEESDTSASKSLVVDSQAPIQIGQWKRSDNQVKGQLDVFLPEYADNLTGEFRIKTNKHGSDQYIHAWDRAYGNNDRRWGEYGNAITWPFDHGSRNQLWTYSSLGLLRGISGKCMTAGTRQAGGNIFLDTCHTDSSNTANRDQVWHITRDGLIQLAGTQLCIDTEHVVNNRGWNLALADCDSDQRDQVFEMILDKEYRFSIGGDNLQLSLDATGQFGHHGHEYILAAQDSDHPNLKFRVTPNGYIRSQGQHKRCLSVAKHDNLDQHEVHGRHCGDQQAHQEWIVGDTFIQLKADTRFCLQMNSLRSGERARMSPCRAEKEGQRMRKEWFEHASYPDIGLRNYVQISTSLDFEDQDILWQGWQASRRIQFACADLGLERCLEDGEPVFVRTKAADNVHDHKSNISRWSSVHVFNPDFTRPVIDSLDTEVERIRPQTPQDYSRTVSFSFEEDRISKAFIKLTHQETGEEIVFDSCLIQGKLLPCTVEYLGDQKQVEIPLNGFDGSQNMLKNGVYSLVPVVENENGIPSDDTVSPTSSIIIDTEPGYVYFDHSKTFNTHPKPTIQGWINHTPEEDNTQNPTYSDITTLEYALNDGEWRTLSLTSEDDSILKTFNLPLHINEDATVKLRVIDSVGNVNEKVKVKDGVSDELNIKIDISKQEEQGEHLLRSDAKPGYSLMSTNPAKLVDNLEEGDITSEDLHVWNIDTEVASGVDYVKVEYAPYPIIEDQENSSAHKTLGYMNNNPKQKWFTRFADITQHSCEEETCQWEYEYIPTADQKKSNHTIFFHAFKDGELVETVTRTLLLEETTGSTPQDILAMNSEASTTTAQKFNQTYFTNGSKITITGVARPNTELEYSYKGGIEKITTSKTGLWSVELDTQGDNAKHIFEIAPTSTPEYTLKLTISKDTQHPQLNWVRTTNISRPLAQSPWLVSGDDIEFIFEADEPLITSFEHTGIYGELQNEANVTHLQNNQYKGNLTINFEHEGIYWTYLKLSDLAGNKVFFSNDPEMKEKTIDLQDDEDLYPQIAIPIENGEYGEDKKVASLPQYPLGRADSKDFTLRIDGKLTRKHNLKTEDWNSKNAIDADGKLPEVDRLLTQEEYFTENTCFEVEKPADTCPQPVYTYRGDTIQLQGMAEKHQRAVIRVTKGKGLIDGDVLERNTISEFTEFKTVSAGSSQCSPSNDNNEKGLRGLVTTRYQEDCVWNLEYTFEDDGLSPEGIPYNYYIFDTYSIDGAGNLAQTCAVTDLEELKNCEHYLSNSITIYHDTQKPLNTIVNGVFNSEHTYVNRLTKDPVLRYSLSGESRADTEIRQKFIRNTTQDIQRIQLHDQLEQIRNEQTTKSFLNPKAHSESSLVTSHILGEGSQLTLRHGSDTRDDENLDGCSTVSQSPIKHRRIGTCSDGYYITDLRDIDSAGNSSEVNTRTIERDTVRPDQPTVSGNLNGDIIKQHLGVSIEGEAGTTAHVEISIAGTTQDHQRDNLYRQVQLDANGTYSNANLLSNLACGGVKYTITVWLRDAAGNTSQTTTSNTVVSQECPRCSSSGDGALQMPVDNALAFVTGQFPRYQGATGNPHAGIDFGAPMHTPIMAAGDGTVIKSTHVFKDNYGKRRSDPNWKNGWANYVAIDHGGGLITIYAHLTPKQAVTAGQSVTAGQTIGYMGSTGASTGPHLHFQVEKQGAKAHAIHQGKSFRYSPVNPNDYLGDIDGNLNEKENGYFCTYTGTGGTSEHKWGKYRSAHDLPGSHEIGKKLDKNRNVLKNYLGPKPEITYLDISEEHKSVEVYGLAAHKNMPLRTKMVKEEECNWRGKCKFNDQNVSDEEYVKNAQIVFFKNGFKDEITDFAIEDNDLKGRFAFKLKLGEQINIENHLCIRTKLHGNFTYENMDYNRGKQMELDGNCFRVRIPEDIEEPFRVKSTWHPKNDLVPDEIDGKKVGLVDENGLYFANKDYRNISFDFVENRRFDLTQDTLKNEYDGSRIWVIVHGWYKNKNDENLDRNYMVDPADESKLLSVADLMRDKYPDDIILALDWREAATYGTNKPYEVNGAMKWIRPVARESAEKLKRWGVDSGSEVHFIGHSLGTLLSTEIARELGGVESLHALEPPSQLTPSGDSIFKKGDIDGNTKEVQNALDDEDYYKRQFKFSRSFVGSNSIAGSDNLSKTAHESFEVVFGPCGVCMPGSEHSRIIDIFIRLNTDRKLRHNGDELITLDKRWRHHDEFKTDYFSSSFVVPIKGAKQIFENSTHYPVSKKVVDILDSIRISFNPAYPYNNDNPMFEGIIYVGYDLKTTRTNVLMAHGDYYTYYFPSQL